VSKILSQEEIDALLASAAVGRAPEPAAEAPAVSTGGNVVVYNFRRPDRVSKDQMRSMHLLHDRFALNVSTSLGAFLRAMTEVSIVSVEQFAYSEFLMSLPDPTAFYAIGLQPLDGQGALELNPAVAFTMVDRMLGGTGNTPGPNRALTEI
jgi:flagellar motor switch protein FliM